jgi:DNA-binding CsgD family transcriptional regulator
MQVKFFRLRSPRHLCFYKAPKTRSRHVGPQAGRALEMLGHAIEYLTDEYVHNPGQRKGSDSEVQAIQILMALNRSVFYESAEEHLTTAEAMANANPTAIFVLTADGTVRHWNTSAGSLLRSSDGLVLDNGRLHATDSHTHHVMARLLRDVPSLPASPSGDRPHGVLALPRSAGKRPLQAIVMPLDAANKQGSSARLLLLVSDPEKTSAVPSEVLRVLYSLTPAEVEIANGLIMGYSAETISKNRRVSVTTIRQQIKSMLQKTGTTRQSDMIRLFLALPQMPVPEK